MRILELCFSEGRGGLELYAAQASHNLAIRGHQVLCVGTAASFFAQRCGDNRMLVARRNRWVRIRRLLWLCRAIRQFLPDVIHVHCRRDFPLAVIARKMTNKIKPRIVYHRHTELPLKVRDDVYHRFLYAQVDILVAITRRMGDRARETLPLPPDRITVLPHGIELAPNSDVTHEESVLPRRNRNILRIGCFARIDERKRQHDLVKAAALLAERGIAVQVIFFGVIQDPNYHQRLTEMVETSGLNDRVYYHGFVDNPQNFMACCDIVVHAATAEPFGLVIAEAMASGVAVVAANAGGVAEIIQNDEVGILYTPGNAGELASHLEGLALAPERRQQLARNGQTLAVQEFSRDKHYKRLDALLSGSARAQVKVLPDATNCQE